jgi:hypothetical protein
LQPKPSVIRDVREFAAVVREVGPLVPVSVAAAFEGVSRQAVYARATARWLVDGMVMVPCRLDKCTAQPGVGKVLGQSAISPDNRPD